MLEGCQLDLKMQAMVMEIGLSTKMRWSPLSVVVGCGKWWRWAGCGGRALRVVHQVEEERRR